MPGHGLVEAVRELGGGYERIPDPPPVIAVSHEVSRRQGDEHQELGLVVLRLTAEALLMQELTIRGAHHEVNGQASVGLR